MLVVTANWAIGDGTVHGGPPRESVQAFVRAMRRAAWRAGFRRDGRYLPLESVQIVLAGDTFDGLASLAWQGAVRPWHEGGRARAMADLIAAAAARRGARLLAALRRLARDGLPVPRADARGRPIPGIMQPAAATVVFLVGDRDRVLERGCVPAAARLGFAIGSEQASDAILVRHGADCDPLCGLADRPECGRPPTLGESLAVDLLAEFTRRLLASSLPRQATALISRRLAKAPPLDMPVLLADRLAAMAVERTVSATAAVREAWLRSVQHWLEQAHATPPEVGVTHDVVDAVAGWMESAVGEDTVGSSRGGDAAIESLRIHVSGGGAGRMRVLGHPADIRSAAVPPPHEGTVCLGPAEPGNWSRRDAWPHPPAIVFPDPWAAPAEWLPLDEGDDRSPWRRPRVTRVGAFLDEPGIVDAA